VRRGRIWWQRRRDCPRRRLCSGGEKRKAGLRNLELYCTMVWRSNCRVESRSIMGGKHEEYLPPGSCFQLPKSTPSDLSLAPSMLQTQQLKQPMIFSTT